MGSFFVGVDLGQAQDFTALVILEQELQDTGRVTKTVVRSSTVYQAGKLVAGPGTQVMEQPVMEGNYQIRHLERFALGEPYPNQVANISRICKRLGEIDKDVHLIVDQTGVGRPVVDMLRKAGLKVIAVTIIGGDAVNGEGLNWRVPKRDLVSILQVLFQSGRLKIASSLSLAKTLVNELKAFKVSISLRGHDSYGNDVSAWRENPHDDLVLATALAVWWGERQVMRAKVRPYTTMRH